MKPPNAGKGRKRGVPNKATANARQAIAEFIDGNADRLQGWLDAIAEDEKQGPRAALECFKDLLEYHVPKLARTELTGKDGGPIGVQIVRFSDPAQPLDAPAVPDAHLGSVGTGLPPRSSGVAPSKR